jgi:hypothetical protein
MLLATSPPGEWLGMLLSKNNSLMKWWLSSGTRITSIKLAGVRCFASSWLTALLLCSLNCGNFALSVSSAECERGFSHMKLIKTETRNQLKTEFPVSNNKVLRPSSYCCHLAKREEEENWFSKGASHKHSEIRGRRRKWGWSGWRLYGCGWLSHWSWWWPCLFNDDNENDEEL